MESREATGTTEVTSALLVPGTEGVEVVSADTYKNLEEMIALSNRGVSLRIVRGKLLRSIGAMPFARIFNLFDAGDCLEITLGIKNVEDGEYATVDCSLPLGDGTDIGRKGREDEPIFTICTLELVRVDHKGGTHTMEEQMVTQAVIYRGKVTHRWMEERD